jgi:hypothetical protein
VCTNVLIILYNKSFTFCCFQKSSSPTRHRSRERSSHHRRHHDSDNRENKKHEHSSRHGKDEKHKSKTPPIDDVKNVDIKVKVDPKVCVC